MYLELIKKSDFNTELCLRHIYVIGDSAIGCSSSFNSRVSGLNPSSSVSVAVYLGKTFHLSPRFCQCSSG